PTQDCILLGPQPSLIVKFKNPRLRSSQSANSKEQFLGRLSSSSHLNFYDSSTLSTSSEVIYFNLQQDSIQHKQSTSKICYTQTEIDLLISQIKKANSDIQDITPNILSGHSSLNTTSLTNSDYSMGTNQWSLSAPSAQMNVLKALSHSKENDPDYSIRTYQWNLLAPPAGIN